MNNATLIDIVDLHRRGRITHNRASRMLRALARRIIARKPEATDYDRRNLDTFVDRIVEHPVESWPAAWFFWQRSVELDAPWVIWLDPKAVN